MANSLCTIENNVLIHSDTLAIKLIDLCACREITPSEVSPSEYAGTLVYASPEVRTRNFFNPESQDVYALGVLLLFLLFQGRFPSSVNLDKEFLESSALPKAIKESKLEVYSATVKMLQGILSKRVEKRPGIGELVDTVQSRLDAMAGDS